MVRKTDIMIIGGGQAGLAISRCLSRLGLDHVVVERGEIGQRWRSERWNSLRLLTPNWMTRLPGHSYTGADPDGFMHKDQFVRMLASYGAMNAEPVLTRTAVHSVRRRGEGFCIGTDRGNWIARAVVVATGACDTPRRPEFAGAIAPEIRQLALDVYKMPAQVDDGGVLVVGASASGIQIASELQDAGHQVTLAVGQHTRIPRRYRGRDIMDWLDRSGVLTRPREPRRDSDTLTLRHSFQLVGDAAGRPIDLNTFRARGGEITGRLSGIDGTAAVFDPSLAGDIAQAEARQTKLLRDIDRFIFRSGTSAPGRDPIAPVAVPEAATQLDLRDAGIRTIIWATGYRRDYAWLDVPVLSRRGEIIQQGGVTPVRGLYTMGLPEMRRANSTFIDGVGQDARDIAWHLACQLSHVTPIAA